MSRAQRIIGSSLAGLGSVVALLAFFILPSTLSLDFPIATLQLLPKTAAQQGDLLSWLEGGLTALLLLVSGVQIWRSLTKQQARSRLLLVLAALALLVLLLEALSVRPGVASLEVTSEPSPPAPSFGTSVSPASYLGSGFWVSLMGMVLVLVGGIALALNRRWSLSRPMSTLTTTLTASGGLLACLAFFLPAITTASRTDTGVALLTTTAWQQAIAGERAFVIGGSSALLVVAIAAWQLVGSATRNARGAVGSALLLIVLGVLALVLWLNLYQTPQVVSQSLTRSATSATSSFTCNGDTVSGPFTLPATDTCKEAALSPAYEPGFWLFGLGIVLVVLGGMGQGGMVFPRLLIRTPGRLIHSSSCLIDTPQSGRDNHEAFLKFRIANFF